MRWGLDGVICVYIYIWVWCGGLFFLSFLLRFVYLFNEKFSYETSTIIPSEVLFFPGRGGGVRVVYMWSFSCT